jgi:uncharacterized damage-inducible protein DinB
MRPRITVPSYDELVAMTTPDLLAFRVELAEAAQSIENQLIEAERDGTNDPIWTMRSSTALSHMRRGLATIKAELGRRNGNPQPAPLTDIIQHAFNSLDEIRSALKRANELFAAVQAFTDNDSDDNWARLENLVNDNNVE